MYFRLMFQFSQKGNVFAFGIKAVPANDSFAKINNDQN